MVDLSGLRSGARGILDSFLGIFPGAVVTSALRTVQEQAQAMAENVLVNKDWIKETYLATPASEACQAWVDAFHDPNWGKDYIASGLLGVLKSFEPGELSHLSWHLVGSAFDISPDSPDYCEMVLHLEQAVAAHMKAGGKAKLLLKEGGLSRIHVQADDGPLNVA